MASIGELRSLWWEFKRRTISRKIKAAGLTIDRSLWWDRKGWEHVRKVWIFSVSRDFANIHYELDEVHSELERLYNAHHQISNHLVEINRLGHDVRICMEQNPRFFYVGAESDEWLIHYRLMFGETSIFDDNVSRVDTRV